MTIAGNAPPRRPVYLDYQATTPADPRVVAAMLPYFFEHFGNAHSTTHPYGWLAEEAVTLAREQVADLIGAETKEIVFTSGATESNNLAIKGVADFYGSRRKHLITVATEHRCVLESCRRLEREGYALTTLPVDRQGRIDLDQLAQAITDDTLLVSVMAVNNEIGVIQPLAAIGAMCRSRGVFFHTDAAQAVGKIPLDVNAMNIDLMSLSAHKLYGPKGIGALYVRRRPRVRLAPLIDGGGQEQGLRSGTLATPLCVAMGEACRLAGHEMADNARHLKTVRDRFLAVLSVQLPDHQVNGDMVERIPGNLNISFPYIEGDRLLPALGLDSEMAHASLRIGFGRSTSVEDAEFAALYIADAVKSLRRESPLWALHQEGIVLSTIGHDI
jgi:cysteine desulfurase